MINDQSYSAVSDSSNQSIKRTKLPRLLGMINIYHVNEKFHR